jgi:hypothetical protein
MNYFFVALLVLCTIYAFVVGGAPERIGASAYALAVAATHVILLSHAGRWQGLELGVFTVDLLLFMLFSILAVRANRFWPIWVSGFLGLGVLGHLARWAEADVFWWAYAVIMSIWSYPILAIIALGTWNHHRRIRLNGVDKPWSTISGGLARRE